METNNIKTIEQKLSLYAALGTAGYYSSEAMELKKKLREMREKEMINRLKIILCQVQSS